MYAGDIHEKEEYQGIIGLSLNRNDYRHLLDDYN
jgi:hypothetical protein